MAIVTKTVYVVNGHHFDDRELAEEYDRNQELIEKFTTECWYRGAEPEEVVAWFRDNFTLTPKVPA